MWYIWSKEFNMIVLGEFDMIDFEKDLREIVTSTLDRYHVKYKNKDDLQTLLIRLYTFWEKYIEPRKRDVLMSQELKSELAIHPKSVQISLDKMSEWIRTGVDINCFQSRGLYGKGNRDYQNMLYGIVHLHLSANKDDIGPVVKKDGFAKPGQYILFAYFTETSAYFIKVLKHPESFGKDGNISVEWISKDLISIIEHNWPELLAGKRIEGAILCDKEGTPLNIDDNTIAALSTNHINTFVNLGNTLYMPGLGIMSSGDSASSVLKSNRMLNNVKRAQNFYVKNEMSLHEHFIGILNRNNRPVPSAFDVHYEYFEPLNCFLIVDRNSGAFFNPDNKKIGILFTRE